MKNIIVPIFVPHKGCPHDCIFCNQKRITGSIESMTPQEARNIIEEYMENLDPEKSLEIAFFGGSFTAIPRDEQEELLEVAWEYKQRGLVRDIRLSTRPDAISQDQLDFLKYYGVTTIELGVQSMDRSILDVSNRGHDDVCVHESSRLILKNGFKLGLQMMVGLPGDSLEKELYTLREFLKIAPQFIRIYPVLVIRDTELESLFKNKIYEPLTVEETIERVKKLLVICEKNDLKVIRVGLQTSEDISLGKDVLGGPFHPSLREKIEARMYRDFFEIVLKEKSAKIFNVPQREISKALGNKKENIDFLRTFYSNEIQIKAHQKDTISIEGEEFSRQDFIEKLNVLYGL